MTDSPNPEILWLFKEDTCNKHKLKGLLLKQLAQSVYFPIELEW